MPFSISSTKRLIPVDFAFLDSGTGGLPYMQYLQKACPSATCMYLADTKNFPYGEKTSEQIIEAAKSAVSAILSKYIPSAIVIACNTMSVTALSALRKEFSDVSFVGTVPAIKLAAKLTKKHKIGLLATRGTVNHPYTKQLQTMFAHDCTLVKRGDRDLVDFIEHRLCSASASEIETAIMPAVTFFIAEHVDIIILGCTHFLRIADEIQKIANKLTLNTGLPPIQVIDSREGVVRQAMKIATNSKMNFQVLESVPDLDFSKGHNSSLFYITGSEPSLGFYKNTVLAYDIKYAGVI